MRMHKPIIEILILTNYHYCLLMCKIPKCLHVSIIIWKKEINRIYFRKG